MQIKVKLVAISFALAAIFICVYTFNSTYNRPRHQHLNRLSYLDLIAEHDRKVSRALINPVKVFQIGFSKCGTDSLCRFFSLNGVACVHHDYGKLALSIHQNFLSNKPLISHDYAKFYVFTDMERLYADPPLSIGMLLFKELDKQYPGSKFILNTRNKEAWLKSRSLHNLGKPDANLLEITKKILNKTKEEVLAQWSQEWDEHHRAVIEYFKNRPADLLIFNIETDPPEKLVAFFKANFYLDLQYYKHTNKTLDRDKSIIRESKA